MSKPTYMDETELPEMTNAELNALTPGSWGGFEGSLLAAARAEQPARSAEAKVLAGLGLGPLPVATTGTQELARNAASTSAASGSLGSKALLALVGIGAVGGLALWLGTSGEPATNDSGSPAPEAPVVMAPAEESAPEAAVEAQPEEHAALTLDDLQPVEDDAPRAEAQPARPKVAPAAPQPSLKEELAVIRRAQAALRSGQLGTASQALAEHARRFPRPQLGAEARVLRVDLLVRQGRRAEAESLAGPLLKTKSPYADRVRSLLGK